jgi:hypothetical protein
MGKGYTKMTHVDDEMRKKGGGRERERDQGV